jgi:hypothetical protein
MEEQELWSFTNAFMFILIIFVGLFIIIFVFSNAFNLKNIKNDWPNQRCNPMIMPFARVFGYNTSENFNFCMGSVFNKYSGPFIGSTGTIFSHFTGLLHSIFDSISSLRNTIASLGGGINVIFQEFTERISFFFFKIRVSAIHIKTLIQRMYAILFSVMYMGLSGITGMTSFTNTFLFSFLDLFCFPGNTELNIKGKGLIPIKDIKIGDIIEPSNSRVTATFRFFSRGQPMVKLGPITVSKNHYVMYLNHPIKAGDHPDAIIIDNWESDEPLYCLNTSDNYIHIDGYKFLDYDETSDGDIETMNFIEGRINAINNINKQYKFNEYSPAISTNSKVKTKNGIKNANDIKIGDILSTGSIVTGLIQREVNEVCIMENGTIITPSTLFWNSVLNKWIRLGDTLNFTSQKMELISFIVTPNSQIELEDGLRIRDYMELCSPDSEMYYSKHLECI